MAVAKAAVKPRTKTDILKNISETTGLSRKEVVAVFEEMGALMKKDLGIGVDLGKALDIPVPIAAAAYQMYAAASTLGHGSDDFSAVSKTMEKITGVNLGESGQ